MLSISKRFEAAAAACSAVVQKRHVYEEARGHYGQIDLHKKMSISPSRSSRGFCRPYNPTAHFAVISHCYDQVEKSLGEIRTLEKKSGLSLRRDDVKRLGRETTKTREILVGIRAFCVPQTP